MTLKMVNKETKRTVDIIDDVVSWNDETIVILKDDQLKEIKYDNRFEVIEITKIIKNK